MAWLPESLAQARAVPVLSPDRLGRHSPVAAAAAAGRLSLGAAAAPDEPPGCQGQRALPVSTLPPELQARAWGRRRPQAQAGGWVPG